MIRATLTSLVLFSCLAACVQAANWPAWRGAKGDGISTEASLPDNWSPTENVLWKVSLPGEGNSTPIIWEDKVFVTCPINGGKIRSLFCFDRKTGKQLWKREVPFPEKETTHGGNPFCSGSPVTDGKRVYAAFGSAGAIACDLDGKLLWQRELPILTYVFGAATTPILYKDLVIIHRGPGDNTHVIALDNETGKTVWDNKEVGRNDNLFGSWSTPVVISVDGHDELIVVLPDVMKAYDPLTGKELWRCSQTSTSNYAMPSFDENFVYAVSGFRGPTFAVEPGGKGDVTKTRRKWFIPKTPQRIGSAVVHDGYIYVANDTGIAECIDTKTGKSVWQKRLGGRLWSSVLLADGKLYTANQQGEIFILEASPKYRLIRKIEMKEHIKSSLAPSDGQLFIRTYENLYCIGKRKRLSS